MLFRVARPWRVVRTERPWAQVALLGGQGLVTSPSVTTPETPRRSPEALALPGLKQLLLGSHGGTGSGNLTLTGRSQDRPEQKQSLKWADKQRATFVWVACLCRDECYSRCAFRFDLSKRQ